jgi:mannosyl-3-phosphoglycerate phosphatase
LLDPSNYSYDESLNAIKQLKEKKVPIVFCSSKTKAEQEVYRQLMEIKDPFIVENGSAIYIPKKYFSFSFEFDSSMETYFVIELGVKYDKIRTVLDRINKIVDVRFFGNMSVEEVSEVTGLSLELASLAKQREYSETLILNDHNKYIVLKMIRDVGLNWTYGGRFYNVIGKTDKGNAVKKLVELFKKEFGKIKSIGIGDNLNDLPMLEVVDKPFLIKRERDESLVLNLPNVCVIESFEELLDEIF